MPNAVEANDLVNQWWALAVGLARKWGARWPWLTDDFTSVAAEALWRLSTSHGHLEPAAFAGYVRQGVRWAILRRLSQERRRNPVAFQQRPVAADPDADELVELLDLVADGAPDVGQQFEDADAAAVLLKRAGLTERQRGIVRRHFFEGEQQVQIAAGTGVSKGAVSKAVGAALVKLRAAAG